MVFRFVHTADWQLGKPFAGFDPDVAASLREARLAMIDRIASAARDEGAAHILVAGDVWDQALPSDKILLQPVDRMAAASDCHWWLLPGNHDPAEPESLWDRLAAKGLPANVHPLTEPKAAEMEEGIFLLPAPWTSKRPGRDLSAALDTMETPPGAYRIGLAHGGVQGFGSDPDASHPIAADRADRAGLSYLALGDWHGMKKAGPRAWYSGTPEPDRFRNNDAGAALLVEQGHEESPRRIDTKSYDWQMETVQLDRLEDPLSDLQTALSSSWPAHRRLVQIALSGTVTLDQRRALHGVRRDLEARLAHLDWRDDELEVLVDQEDGLSDHADPVIAEAVRRLSSSPDPEAQAALLILDDLLRAS